MQRNERNCEGHTTRWLNKRIAVRLYYLLVYILHCFYPKKLCMGFCNQAVEEAVVRYWLLGSHLSVLRSSGSHMKNIGGGMAALSKSAVGLIWLGRQLG